MTTVELPHQAAATLELTVQAIDADRSLNEEDRRARMEYHDRWRASLTRIVVPGNPQAERIIERARERELWRSARALKRRFNRDFWMEDEGFYALTLDPDKRLVRAITSNVGNCLATGILDRDRLPRVVERLFAPDMFSGWGIRTLSTRHAAYNPLSYHLGTVWAVESATICFGLRRFGFDAEAVRLARALFDLAALYTGGRIPETVGATPARNTRRQARTRGRTHHSSGTRAHSPCSCTPCSGCSPTRRSTCSSSIPCCRIGCPPSSCMGSAWGGRPPRCASGVTTAAAQTRECWKRMDRCTSGRSQRLTTNNKKEELPLDDRTVEVRTKWDDGRLVKETSLGDGMKLTETYSLLSEPRRLHVMVKLDSSHRPRPVNLRRVYDAAYDTKSEATFEGTVADVKTTGRSASYWLFRIHTLGQGQMGVQEKQLLLKTDTGTAQIQLAPTRFLAERKVEIRKNDILEVTGSRVTIGESPVVLAREIRKGDNAWVLRDATGQPLWSSVETTPRGFWTKKKVLFAVVAIKAVALATVLRH